MGNLTPYDAIMSPVIAACILVLPVCGYTVSNADRVNESAARYIV